MWPFNGDVDLYNTGGPPIQVYIYTTEVALQWTCRSIQHRWPSSGGVDLYNTGGLSMEV